MKICFNLQNVGLGNNGGSRTIIFSAETLARLGHEVYMWNPVMKYTWHQPQGLNFVKKEPKADVLIATGAGSYESTIKSKNKNKWVWIRGWETWSTPEKVLINYYKQLKCMVNSEWQYYKLQKHKIKSHIVYPGLDFDKFYNKNEKNREGVGFLWHERHKTKNHHFAQKVVDQLNCNYKRLNKDIKNPDTYELNNWYNALKVWLATTCLEGLHNPPQEACLAGCSLVCNDHYMNGMTDYTVHEETALVYEYGNINQAKEYCNQLLNHENLRKKLNENMVDLLKNKIGSREENMKKLINIVS